MKVNYYYIIMIIFSLIIDQTFHQSNTMFLIHKLNSFLIQEVIPIEKLLLESNYDTLYDEINRVMKEVKTAKFWNFPLSYE